MLGCWLPIRRPGRPVSRQACPVHQPSQQAAEKADLEPVTAPRPLSRGQRGEDADDRVLPREHVDQGHADLGRLAVRLAGDAHQATDRLDDEVVAEQVLPPVVPKPVIEQYDPRVVRGDRLVAQSEPLHRPGLEVLDDDIGAQRELACSRKVGRVAQVEDERLLRG